MSEAVATMPKTRWTKPRIARMCFLIGRGLKAEDVASDALVSSYAATVRTIANSLGLAFSDVPRGNLMIDIGGRLPNLAAIARERCETPESLMSRAARILADDPTLLANVLDDDG